MVGSFFVRLCFVISIILYWFLIFFLLYSVIVVLLRGSGRVSAFRENFVISKSYIITNLARVRFFFRLV